MGEVASKCCASRKTVAILKAGGEDNIERRKMIASLFDDVDMDVNGFLSHDELMMLGKATADNPEAWSEKENKDFFAELDLDNDGDIERSEFIDFYDKKFPDDDHMDEFRTKVKKMEKTAVELRGKKPQAEKAQIERRQALAEVFDELDVDVSGCLSETELKAMLGVSTNDSGAPAADDTNAKLFKEMDKSQDGLIDRIEFVKHYEEKLPQDKMEFLQQIENMRACAKKRLEEGYNPLE